MIDTTEYLHRALAENKKILMEGQLGALRDPDHGIYPFVTFLLAAGGAYHRRRRRAGHRD